LTYINGDTRLLSGKGA